MVYKSMSSFVRNQQMCHNVAVPFCIPISNEGELLLLHIFVSIWCCQGFRFWLILEGVWWCLIVVLICISMMTHDMEHLFLCLLAICISSLVRYLLRSLRHFSIRLFVLLLLSLKSSWYILHNSPLSVQPSSANTIFFPSL